MVFRDGYIRGSFPCPSEYNTPLIIDPYRVPSGAFSLQGFQAISRGNQQVSKFFSGMKSGQFTGSNPRDLRVTLGPLCKKEFLCLLINK
jgi:hypothetical protein